jgi:hypothetical protein
MDDYVRDLLEEAPDEMQGIAATPAADHLFTINVDRLEKARASHQVFTGHSRNGATTGR